VPSVAVRHSSRRCRLHPVSSEVAFAPRHHNGRPASGPQGPLDPPHAGLSPQGCDRKASGPVVDAETGFVYLRARYYDPATGQFLSRDPLVALTGSAYGYVDGNPLNGIDPTGLCWGPGCWVEAAGNRLLGAGEFIVDRVVDAAITISVTAQVIGCALSRPAHSVGDFVVRNTAPMGGRTPEPEGRNPKPSPNFLEPTNPAQSPPNESSLPPGHSVRLGPPTDQYPNGYWVETNAGGQPIDPSTGKPPSNVTRPEARARTHVPLPPR